MKLTFWVRWPPDWSPPEHRTGRSYRGPAPAHQGSENKDQRLINDVQFSFLEANGRHINNDMNYDVATMIKKKSCAATKFK